jgi:hypothetical protein
MDSPGKLFAGKLDERKYGTILYCAAELAAIMDVTYSRQIKTGRGCSSYRKKNIILSKK